MAQKCGKLKTDTKRAKSVLYEPFYDANSMCKSFQNVYMSTVCMCVCLYEVNTNCVAAKTVDDGRNNDGMTTKATN